MVVRVLLGDLAIGLAAGCIATNVADWVERGFQRAALDAEDAQPHDEKSSTRLLDRTLRGTDADDCELHVIGNALHHAFGLGWGGLYGLLRRYWPANPLVAGLCIGPALALVVDEFAHPALGVTPPPERYSLKARACRLGTRTVYGLTVALAAAGLSLAMKPRG